MVVKNVTMTFMCKSFGIHVCSVLLGLLLKATHTHVLNFIKLCNTCFRKLYLRIPGALHFYQCLVVSVLPLQGVWDEDFTAFSWVLSLISLSYVWWPFWYVFKVMEGKFLLKPFFLLGCSTYWFFLVFIYHVNKDFVAYRCCQIFSYSLACSFYSKW